MDATVAAFFARQDARQVVAALQVPVTLSPVADVTPRKGIRCYAVGIGSAHADRFVAVAKRVHVFATIEALRAAVSA